MMSDYALWMWWGKYLVHSSPQVMQFYFICYNFTSGLSFASFFPPCSRALVTEMSNSDTSLFFRKRVSQLTAGISNRENSFTSLTFFYVFFGPIVEPLSQLRRRDLNGQEMIFNIELIVSESNIWLWSGIRNHSGHKTDDVSAYCFRLIYEKFGDAGDSSREMCLCCLCKKSLIVFTLNPSQDQLQTAEERAERETLKTYI